MSEVVVKWIRGSRWVGFGAVAFGCVVGLAAPVAAATSVTVVELTGTPTKTDVSGFRGSAFTVGDPNSNDRGLFAILSRERSDEPCYVSVSWENLNQSGTSGALTKALCGGNGPTSGYMGGSFANTGGNANRVFITGVQVCMNSGDDRIKGIHLRGQRINDAGALVSFSPDAQDSRTNCHQDHWKRWVNCPAGAIATAAILHFEAGNTPRSWTGIELKCRQVRATSRTTAASTEPFTLDKESKGLKRTIDCTDTQAQDMRAVAWNIADDWGNYSKKLERATGKNVGDCLRDRFSGNGEVQCVQKTNCNKDGTKCKLGFGGGLGTKIKIFKTFFDGIKNMPQPDRRACYAALMTHEFSHTCEHYAEKGPEARASAAFDYWKGRFAVSSGLKIDDDCGMND